MCSSDLLTPGAGVVTTRFQTQYVVTEYGAAYLLGKGLAERQNSEQDCFCSKDR